MKTTLQLVLPLVLFLSATICQAQGARYHGPLCNGTINDATIVPRSAVPVGTLKGIKRDLTDQVITGDVWSKNPVVMMSGDDMQRGATYKRTAKKTTKPRSEPKPGPALSENRGHVAVTQPLGGAPL